METKTSISVSFPPLFSLGKRNHHCCNYMKNTGLLHMYLYMLIIIHLIIMSLSLYQETIEMTCLIFFKDFSLSWGHKYLNLVATVLFFCTERPGPPEVQTDVVE